MNNPTLGRAEIEEKKNERCNERLVVPSPFYRYHSQREVKSTINQIFNNGKQKYVNKKIINLFVLFSRLSVEQEPRAQGCGVEVQF